jgi:hypothetical protein
MESINIGIVNLVVSKKLKDAYFGNTLIKESKQLTEDFFNVVKSSPILQLEFKVFNNLETKHIDNDVIAARYIDNNIKLFEIYTNKEIEREHEKLKPFLTEDIQVDDSKVQLYIAINNLIKESLNNYEDVNVDVIHESFETIMGHIKSPKTSEIENPESKFINEDVIEIAVNKFNEKYDSLNEEEKQLLLTLIKSTPSEKETLLESFKNEGLSILEGLNKESVKDSVAKAIQKIKEMKFNPQTADDDIISLFELKKSIL